MMNDGTLHVAIRLPSLEFRGRLGAHVHMMATFCDRSAPDRDEKCAYTGRGRPVPRVPLGTPRSAARLGVVAAASRCPCDPIQPDFGQKSPS